MVLRVCVLVAFLAFAMAGCASRPRLTASQAKLVSALAQCVRTTQSHVHRNESYTSLCAANAFNRKGLIGVTRSELLKFVGTSDSNAHVVEMSYPVSTVGAGSVGGPVVLTLHFGPGEVVDTVWLVAVQ